jgi:hypothetical protein
MTNEPKKKRGKSSLICELALEHQLINRKQLAQAIRECKQRKKEGSVCTIEAYLVEKQFISKSKMEFLIKTQDYLRIHREDQQYARVLLERDIVSQRQINEMFVLQSKLFKKKKRVVPIGDIFLKSGMITSEQDQSVRSVLQNFMQKNASSSLVYEQESRLVGGSQFFGDKPESSSPGYLRPKEAGYFNPEVPGDEIYLSENLVLSFSDDAMEAFLRYKRSPFGESMKVDEVKALLDEQGIHYGIVDDTVIDGFLKSEVFQEKPFRVAVGVSPEVGQDAKLNYFFETTYLKSGTLTVEGKIDFKERGKAPFVRKDDLLVEKIPGYKGTVGMNIYGEVIPVPEVKDPKIFSGSGTSLSEDGLRLYATLDGQPLATPGHKVSVFADMNIDGDVGFKTGHIEFDGNVIVKGSVKDGFRVNAANLRAVDITGGEIHVMGDAVISGTISESTIYAKGNVEAVTIRKSTIHAVGNIIAKKMIIDSTIENSGSCIVENGRIVSSKITSKMGIQAKIVGTEVSEPCQLSAGMDTLVVREVKGIENGIERHEKQLGVLQEQCGQLHTRNLKIQKESTVLAHVQDRSLLLQRDLKKELEQLAAKKAGSNTIIEVQKKIAALQSKAEEAEAKIEQLFDQQEKLVDQQAGLKKQIQFVEQEIESLKAEREAILEWSRKKKGIAVIETRGIIQSGTIVSGVHARMALKESVRRASIQEVRITDPDSPVEWEMRILR